MQGPLLLAAVVVMSAGLMPNESYAQGRQTSAAPAVTVRLDVVANPQCATALVLERKIARRSDRIRFAKSGPVKVVRAEFRQTQRSVLGLLTVEQPTGKRASRSIRAGSCEEAVEALALVATVMLDPSSFSLAPELLEPTEEQGGTPGEEEETTSGPLEAGTTEPGTGPAPAESATEATGTPKPSPKRSESKPRPEPPEPDEPDDVSSSLPPFHDADGSLAVSAGVAAIGNWGPTPSILPGAAVYAAVKWQRPSLWAPAARATFLHARRGEFQSQFGTAHFALTGAMLELCPLALVAGRLELRPCAMSTVGVLFAEGSATENATSELRPWWVLGGSATLIAYLTELVELSAQAAAGGALVRDRFQFRPSIFYEVPELAISAAIGLGVRFP